MDGHQSRPGNSDQMLLGLIGKGFDGYFKAPDNSGFTDLLAKLATVSATYADDDGRADEAPG